MVRRRGFSMGRDLLPRNHVRSETRGVHPDAQDRGPRAVDERPASG
ncbi:hypothetical protein [Dietzia lutea]|nr:hypothetical protein [Dietzia lutea]